MSGERETVVVTGSSGLIGAALAGRLDQTYDEVGFDRPGEPHPPAHVEYIDLDVASDDSVRDGLRQLRERHGDRIASVVHLAAYYDFKGEPSDKYEQVTVRGTERLLKGLQDFQVEQFVFSSTMLVHAPGEPGRKLTEDSPLGPTWDYPKSKVRTEELIRAKRGDIPVVLLRIAGVYTDRGESIPLAHQIQRIAEKHLTGHFYPADPARGQAFVHLGDLVDAFVRVIERRKELPPETVLLVGEPETLGYGELQEALGQLLHGEAWSTYRIPAAVAKAGAWVQDHLPFGPEPFIKPWMIDRAADHYELDISRARTLLGWEPKHSLRDTLPGMVEALKRDPDGWYKANRLDPPAGPTEGKSSDDRTSV
ncbi:NAD-dependent epimerase/dehydratase family protein [Gemmata sp.]|uniref:NAD-dependent epimerase/dehydratase family protein n=1 Tax=Gemmata sp. TaxID=1914242 RepID=UPI003F6FDBAE